MAANDQAQERTEQATPKRRQEARERGETARSRELTTMALLLTAGGGLFFMGPRWVHTLHAMAADYFSITRAQIFDAQFPVFALAAAILNSLVLLAPLLGLVTLVALTAPMMLGGWVFSFQALGFKWERLDPVKGLGRVFGLRGLVEMLKAFAKFALITGVGVLFLWAQSDRLLALGMSAPRTGMADSLQLTAWAFLIVSGTTVIIAAADVPFQLWDHARKLKMSKQQLRDELKETEGKPEVKSKIKALQQEMANRRMMEEVPRADVVVTNPEHYSIALRYDAQRMSAPVVVAKGADEVALRIRKVARAHNVTCFSAPPLARAIYFSTKLGRQIPEGLYLAVAQVLAYVFQLRDAGAADGPRPPRPDKLPIPEELRRDG